MKEIMTENIKQNLVCSGIILLSIVIVLLLTPAIPYTPHGIISPLDDTSPPVIALDEVKAYKEVPPGAKEVGFFNVEFLERSNPVETQQKMVAYARELAAQIGANGIIVERLAHGGGMWYLNGKAISL